MLDSEPARSGPISIKGPNHRRPKTGSFSRAHNGLLAPALASGIARIKGVKSHGVRVGVWLSLRQMKALLKRRRKKDYAVRDVLDRRTLGELAVLQAPYQTAGDPAWRFVALPRVALATGGAHVEDRLRKVPEAPSLWGWRCEPNRSEWVASGTRIGWVEGGDLYLDPLGQL